MIPLSQRPQYPVNESSDFVTRVDRRQMSAIFASRTKGMLNRKKGMVAERDFGTIHRFAVYPIRPNTSKVVSGAADNGSGLIRITTSTTHGYSTNDIIYHAEVGGTVEANNVYKITVITTTTYDLVGSTFTNAYTSGGICTDTPIDIYRSFILRDSDTGTEYEVLIGIDENTKTRIYLWDGSAWIELTQKINVKINGAPSQPANTTTTQVVTIDTPTDEAGQVYTLAADSLNGFIVFNTDRSNTASVVLDSTATTLTIPHDITIAPFSWADNDDLVCVKMTGIYDGFNYANGAEPHVRELTVEAQKKMTLFYADNSGSSLVRKDPVQVAKQDDARGLFPSAATGVAATGTVDSFSDPGTPGDYIRINGSQIDAIEITPGTAGYRTGSGGFNSLSEAITGTPYLASIVSGDGAMHGSTTTLTAVTAGAAGNSITLVANGAGVSGSTLTGGSDASASGRLNLVAGYYVEKAFFSVAFQEAGSIASPKLGTDADMTLNIGDGIQVGLAFSEATNSQSYQHVRIYFTFMYRGYQESDPVGKIYLDGSTSAKFPSVSCTVRFDPSLMNKDITAVRMYVAAQTNSLASQADWEENSEEYLFKDEVLLLTTNFTYNNSSQFCYYAAISSGSETTYPQLVGSVADDLLTRLNHEPVTSRTALKPLFGLKVNRQQGAVQIVDQGDSILRRSSYNGDQVHEDDNYPEVTPDEDLNVMHLPLSGSGEIREITLKNGIIYVHRKNEIETYNLFNNENDYLLERNTAQNSIHSCDKGILFAGPAGIRFLPIGAGIAKTMNPLWDNFYDGTLLVDDDSASYITEAFREDMVGEYFSTLEESWFAVEVTIDSEDGGDSEILTFRYSWRTGKWMVRKFHLGDTVVPNLNITDGQSYIRQFQERSDGTMMIVTKRGLFKYPYTAARRYEDGVYSDGRSSDRGIPTDITLNIGGLSNSIPGANILGLKVQHLGESVDGYGFATIRTYRNDRIGAFETKRFRVDDPPIIREFERGGAVEAMQVRISLPDDDLENHKKFDISQLVFVYEQDQVPVAPGR